MYRVGELSLHSRARLYGGASSLATRFDPKPVTAGRAKTEEAARRLRPRAENSFESSRERVYITVRSDGMTASGNSKT